MPSKHTFTIKPIRELLDRYIGDGSGWADPCAGYHSPAELTNDLNPDCPTRYHLHAQDFAEMVRGDLNGVLFDPPYSLQQMKEVYNSVGVDRMSIDDATRFYGNIRDVIGPKIKPGGYAICCAWNSIGFGKKNGFKLVELLLVCHGRAHNDTIVTVEVKAYQQGSLT